MLKDYDLIINYHIGKANVVVDTLSRKTVAVLLPLRAKVTMFDGRALMAELVVKLTHLSQILEEQIKDIQCDWFKQRMLSGRVVNFSIDKDGKLKFRNRMFVPMGKGLRRELLKEAHQ